MSNLHHLPSSTHPDAIAEQAITWFTRLRRENVSVAEQQQFAAWYAASPTHQQAYDEVLTFWEDETFTTLLQAAPLSTGFAPRSRAGQMVQNKAKYLLTLAASVVLVAVMYRPNFSCVYADYCTAIGETRTLQLADGSQITLNSNTALDVHYSPQQRNVTLHQGEALFAVQRNPQQPFVVKAQYSNTRVLGTRFVVREDQDTDSVSVVNGSVAVSYAAQQTAILKANERIVVGQEEASATQHITAGVTVDWSRGSLLFDNATLSDVLAEISRYRRGKVLIQTDALKALKVSGRFDISDTDKALDSLQQTLPIHIYHLSPWLVVVS